MELWNFEDMKPLNHTSSLGSCTENSLVRDNPSGTNVEQLMQPTAIFPAP